MSKQLLYVADPMCSWCWGFAPVIHRIDDAFGDEIPIQVLLGGVRPYTEKPMTEADKDYVRRHWEHVHAASGQCFDFRFFDRDGFVYDSEPSCRAIVVARNLDEALTLTLLERIQRAFYVEGQNTVDEGCLADLAAEVGFDRARFHTTLTSEQATAETEADFALAREKGFTGFPTLVAVEQGTEALVTVGFKTWQQLEGPLSTWVNDTWAGSSC